MGTTCLTPLKNKPNNTMIHCEVNSSLSLSILYIADISGVKYRVKTHMLNNWETGERNGIVGREIPVFPGRSETVLQMGLVHSAHELILQKLLQIYEDTQEISSH